METKPGRRHVASWLVAAALALTLSAACDDSSGEPSPTVVPEPSMPPVVSAATTTSTTSTTSKAPTTSDASSEPTPTATEPLDAAAERPRLDDVAVTLREVASGFDSPVAIAFVGDDPTPYVAEQSGAVRRLGADATGTVILDLSNDVSSGNEQGLLGIAFSPDGEHLYVDYTDRNGTTRVVEYDFDGAPIAASDGRELLALSQPYANHNGGHVRFGPDGMLYIGLGDGGSSGDPQNNAQRLDTLLGSILRIAPDPVGDAPYGVPSDNPFVGREGARPEIWQYGLRNPWRFSFDRVTGDLWIGDVGQNAFEEIDFAPAGLSGVNWGWSHREGLADFAGGGPDDMRDPIHTYSRDEGVAVTGGFVYRGNAIPALRGAYLFADFAAGELRAIDEVDGVAAQVTSLGVDGGQVTSFGEDPDGEIYVLDRGGRILRLENADPDA